MDNINRCWQYRVTQPMLPPDADSPVMSPIQMEIWLNNMDMEGWEFIGFATKQWGGSEPFKQEWWIFRQAFK